MNEQTPASEPRRFQYPFRWQSEAQPIAALIRLGALIPVTVFGDGTDGWSYGLMDLMSEHSLAASDCNRADHFLLRPSDEAMADPRVREAIEDVLRSAADEEDWPIDEARAATVKRP